MTPADPPVKVGTTAHFERSWTSDEALLYALAVGGGRHPTRDLAYVTENSTNVDQKVLPGFAVLINQVQLPSRLGFTGPRGSVMYAGQSIELVGQLPPTGSAHVEARVVEVLDKGKGAVVRVATESMDPITGAPFARTTCLYFLRGRGGFGGERGTGDSFGLPNRPADRILICETRPEQAMLFRLTGDRNPLHSDPAVAERSGFPRPILHGMCTYGMVALELETTYGRDGFGFRSMAARFSAPTLPGDALQIHCWDNGAEVSFQVRCVGSDNAQPPQVVLDQGRLELSGDASGVAKSMSVGSGIK